MRVFLNRNRLGIRDYGFPTLQRCWVSGAVPSRFARSTPGEAQDADAENEDGRERKEEHDHDIEQRRDPVAQRGLGPAERGGRVKERAAPLGLFVRDVAPRAPRDEEREQEKEDAENFEEVETHAGLRERPGT